MYIYIYIYMYIYIYIYMMYIHIHIYVYIVKKHINYLKIKVSFFSSSQKPYQCEIFNLEYVHF